MGKPIAITEHALVEARRRGIGEAIVHDVARQPEQTVEARLGREVRQSRVANPASGKLQLVRVVVDLEGESDTIVTVYRTSKIAKYWRAP